MINKVVEYFKHLKEKILKKRRPSKQEQRELIFSAIPEGKRLKARKLYKALQKTESYQNLDQYFSSLQEFSSLVKEGVVSLKTNPKTKEAFQIIDYSSNSFTPAMSNFYGLFFNPLSIYAFIVKNQYAAARSIEVIREEIAHDGYQLRAEKAVTKKRMKDTLKLLKKLEFQRLRLDICSSLKIYGNAWLRVVKSEKTKTKTLQLLSPTRIMPVIDQVTEEIIGWDYVRGTKVTRYKVDELIHLWMFNAESYKKMGDPPLSSILIDIEADMAFAQFNNQVAQKGFLGGVVFSMEDMPSSSDDPLADDADDLIEEWQDRIDAQLTGAQAGYAPIVMTNLKKLESVSPLGKYEAGFREFRLDVARKTSNILGVPSEKIGISRSETLQYIPSLIEDSINMSFDKSIYYLVNYVDEVLNEYLIEGCLGISDMKVEASGRFGSLTKNAAEAIKILAEAGPIITVNQALEIFLGLDPLPPDNPRGHFVLNNTKPQVLSEGQSVVENISDETVAAMNFYKSAGKVMPWDEFFKFANEHKEKLSGMGDKTYASDEELVCIGRIKGGKEKYLMEYTK